MQNRFKLLLLKLKKRIELISIYIDGLNAAFKVIRDGDIPDYRRVPDEKYPNFKKSYISLYRELKQGLLLKKVPLVKLKYQEVLYFGHTKNNIKEFDFFYEVCKSELTKFDKPSPYNNFELFYRTKARSRNGKLGFLLPFIVLFVFISRRIRLNTTSLHYSLQYTYSFLFYFFNFSSQKRLLPMVAILSNDHTPRYLAASKVLKYFGVYRIYMQHGAVSDLFPKLDFELSVLWNEKSREIYGVDHDKRKVLTISRNIESSDSFKNKDNSDNVIVFLTSLPNITNVNLLIKKLNKCSNVGSVYLQPHPRTKSLNEVEGDFEFINSYKNQHKRFFALVGNSSIALELSLAGVTTFQCFDLDDIGNDYYGFVSDGICQEISKEDISPIFSFPNFSPDKSVLSKYCPIIAGENDSDKLLLCKYVGRALRNSIRNDTLGQDVIDALADKYKNEIELISIIEGYIDSDLHLDSLVDEGAISYEEKLLYKRLKG